MYTALAFAFVLGFVTWPIPTIIVAFIAFCAFAFLAGCLDAARQLWRATWKLRVRLLSTVGYHRTPRRLTGYRPM